MSPRDSTYLLQKLDNRSKPLQKQNKTVPRDSFKLYFRNEKKDPPDSLKILQKPDTRSPQDSFKLHTLKTRQGIHEIFSK